MKQDLKTLIHEAIIKAHEAGHLPSSDVPPFDVEAPKVAAHGDFATNAAMVMAKTQKMAPRQIAQIILDHVQDVRHLIASTEIAGPGFINFFITPTAWAAMLRPVYDLDRQYGAANLGQGRYIQVEFVSANPTGPLHVGHGRGAAVGDSVANILAFCGWNVQREYYINDSGRQIRTLGLSVYCRYQELLGQAVDFPEECYQGDYIRELAETLRQKHGAQLLAEPEADAVQTCARYAAQVILDGIRMDLDAFGIRYDRWFSEQTLYDDGLVDKMLGDLKKTGLVYESEGAWWFNSTQYGDEKDRVVVRQNGQTTYFASDIAYHHEKYSRGFDRVIDVWGADHHGYIPRMSAAIQAVGRQPRDFQVILVQLVNLLRQGAPVAMSTRAGEFETLRDVISEVGADAARFIFLSRHYESPLDFDLDIAKQQTNDNPVYYVQYVHARIASILNKAAASGTSTDVGWQADSAQRLQETEEIELIKAIGHYPEVVQHSARQCEPHRISHYLIRLAGLFHTYYNKHRVLTDDAAVARARLLLIVAVQKVIRNGLTLLGVQAPERM